MEAVSGLLYVACHVQDMDKSLNQMPWSIKGKYDVDADCRKEMDHKHNGILVRVEANVSMRPNKQNITHGIR